MASGAFPGDSRGLKGASRGLGAFQEGSRWFQGRFSGGFRDLRAISRDFQRPRRGSDGGGAFLQSSGGRWAS